ncbi:MAG: type I-U CRISPR-associated protein Csb2 [Thermoplasmata archaeon]
MPLILEQLFLQGRFHATRWNQSPFEDIYGEWPPSPYRLLRALACRWFQYLRETGNSNEKLRDSLLSKLTSSIPKYALPISTWKGKPIKHYQPAELKFKKKKDVPEVKTPERTLVEDHYRVICESDPIYWYWDKITLEDKEIELLDALLKRILYFGRAESLCVIKRVEKLPDDVAINCELKEKREGPFTYSPVLIPLPGQFDINTLFIPTCEMINRAIPEKTSWYYAVLPPASSITPSHEPEIEYNETNLIQFAVGGNVYPTMQNWVKITERFRARVIKKLCVAIKGDESATIHTLNAEEKNKLKYISGKDEKGQPVHGHEHPYFILIPDKDGNPTRFVVWRRTPFTKEETKCILKASLTPRPWETNTSRWFLKFVPLPSKTPPPDAFKEGRIWESAVPFVIPANRHRFRKNGHERSGETPEKNLKRLLSMDNKTMLLTKMELIKKSESILWLNIHRPTSSRRTIGKTRIARPGYWFRLEFERPIEGPLILGESCHFGLGLFVPVG